MRPLNFDAGGELKLTEDLIDKIHPYMIPRTHGWWTKMKSPSTISSPDGV